MTAQLLETCPESVCPAELQQLESAIGRQLRGRVRGLRLSFDGTGLVLFGYADTFHAKQLVLHAVMNGTALQIMANRIEVA